MAGPILLGTRKRHTALALALAYALVRLLTRRQERAPLPVRWRWLILPWLIALDHLWWEVVCGVRRRVILTAPEEEYRAHPRLMLALFPHHMVWPAASYIPRLMLMRAGKAIHLDRAMAAAHSALFAIPLVRELCIALNFRNASRHVGELGDCSMAVFPGGGLEMQRQRPGRDVVVLRRGFVSLAIERGMPIVPVLLCNETSAYRPLPQLAWLRELVYSLTKAGVPLWTGRAGVPLCPLPNAGLYFAVVGRPIALGAARKPTDEDVEHALGQLQAALRALHARFKGPAGRPVDHRLVFDRSRL